MSWTPIPGSHFGATHCRSCGTYVVSIEAEQDNALCMGCGRADHGITWAPADKVGAHHPSVGYPSPGHGPLAPPAGDREPFPAPTVSSRDGVFPDSPPRALASLQMALHAAGWRTLVQYAHGNMPHSKLGSPLAAKPSWALRLEREGRENGQSIGAVAVYRGGAWDALYTWSATQPHRKFPNITSFRAVVLLSDVL